MNLCFSSSLIYSSIFVHSLVLDFLPLIYLHNINFELNVSLFVGEERRFG